MVKQINPRIKNRIKEICEQKKITPYRLSKNINRSKSTISQIQDGQRFPSVDVMIEMCDALGCGIGDLFYVVPQEKAHKIVPIL